MLFNREWMTRNGISRSRVTYKYSYYNILTVMDRLSVYRRLILVLVVWFVQFLWQNYNENKIISIQIKTKRRST